MSATPFRFVSTDRRVREDRRFVVGKGRFAADVVLAGTRHVALVTCPHPAARIVAIDKAEALAMPGVHYVLDGRELAAATQPLLAGLDTPKVPRRPLAVDVARYSGEWVAAVVADTRALAEDAAELVRVDYEPLPFVLDGEEAYAPGSPLVHADHGSNVLLDRTFVWGEVEQDFADSPHRLSLRVRWGRSSTVPVETFAVTGELGPLARGARRLRLGADAALSRPGRARAQAAGLRPCASTTTWTWAAATGSSAASSTRCWSAISPAGSASRCG